MGICQVGIGPTVGQPCVPNTNGPIIAQRWSSTGQTYVFTQCQRTNNYPTLPNVCRTSEQALVKMVSSSTIHKTLSMSFASVANSLAKLIDVFIYNALKHFSCVFYLYIIIWCIFYALYLCFELLNWNIPRHCFISKIKGTIGTTLM